MTKSKRTVLGTAGEHKVALRHGRAACGFAGVVAPSAVEIGELSFSIEEARQLSKLVHKAVRKVDRS